MRLGESVQLKDGVYEVKGVDGKLSVLGQASVMGVVPYPGDAGVVAVDEAKEALRQYAELEKREPGVTALLAESKGAWEKLATAAVAAVPSKGLPEMEEVETAAGVEEPVFHVWPWLAGGLAGLILLGWIGWVRFRKPSASA